jgi:glutathione S-transferase
MSNMALTIGNKNYSSWSLRGYLAVEQTGAAYEENLIPLYEAGSAALLKQHSASGLVPALRHGDVQMWDSLAIAEYLAETFPDAGLWPSEPSARAFARSVSAEMHAGFRGIRTNMPMDIRSKLPGRGHTDDAKRDIMRIKAIWHDCRERFGKTAGKDFLFGNFCAADVMYAPVVFRFATYGVDVDEVEKRYMDAMRARPEMQRWVAAAHEEPWTMDWDVV